MGGAPAPFPSITPASSLEREPAAAAASACRHDALTELSSSPAGERGAASLPREPGPLTCALRRTRFARIWSSRRFSWQECYCLHNKPVRRRLAPGLEEEPSLCLPARSSLRYTTQVYSGPVPICSPALSYYTRLHLLMSAGSLEPCCRGVIARLPRPHKRAERHFSKSVGLEERAVWDCRLWAPTIVAWWRRNSAPFPLFLK